MKMDDRHRSANLVRRLMLAAKVTPGERAAIVDAFDWLGRVIPEI